MCRAPVYVGLASLYHRMLSLLITILGLFVDGALTDTLDWSYPKPESSAQMGMFIIGDASEKASMSWCLASCYLISTPLG